MHYKVNLPDLKWFLFGNNYSGSFRTDETKGCLNQTTFNFKVQPVEINGEKKLMTICYYLLPWNDLSNMDEGYIGWFPLTEFGVEVCENWIRSKFIADCKPQLKENVMEKPRKKKLVSIDTASHKVYSKKALWHTRTAC